MLKIASAGAIRTALYAKKNAPNKIWRETKGNFITAYIINFYDYLYNKKGESFWLEFRTILRCPSHAFLENQVFLITRTS